jgi:hypothetical protein
MTLLWTRGEPSRSRGRISAKMRSASTSSVSRGRRLTVVSPELSAGEEGVRRKLPKLSSAVPHRLSGPALKEETGLVNRGSVASQPVVGTSASVPVQFCTLQNRALKRTVLGLMRPSWARSVVAPLAALPQMRLLRRFTAALLSLAMPAGKFASDCELNAMVQFSMVPPPRGGWKDWR